MSVELWLALGIIVVVIIVSERKAEILDNWSALISGAQGQRDQVISATKELINKSKAPSIEISEREVGPALTSTSFGETRKFLIVADRRSLTLGNFKVTYIGLYHRQGIETSFAYVKHILIGLREHSIPEQYVDYVKTRESGSLTERHQGASFLE